MLRSFLACFLAIAATGAAYAGDAANHAAEPETPFLDYSFYLGLAGDRTIRSDAEGFELFDVNPESTLEVRIHPSDWLTFHIGLTLESVRDLEAHDDRWFGDVGLYVDTLHASVQHEGLTALAGKFTPGFGTAWDVTPGIYSYEFVEDYELSEMIGAGIGQQFDLAAAGTVTASASLFFADTTALSDSLFTRRGRTRLSDGGPGNTGQFDNFALSLDGSDIPALPGFAWHAGHVRLSAGAGDAKDIRGWVAGLNHEQQLAGSTLRLNGEIAWFDGYEGGPGSSAYFTAGAQLWQGPWHGELAGTLRAIDDGVDAWNDGLVQVSGGYLFDKGIDLSAGYAWRSDAGSDSHRVGLRLTWNFENEIPR